MFCAIRERVSCWSRNPYNRFFVQLLVAAAMLFGAMWASGCKCTGYLGKVSKVVGGKGKAPEVHTYTTELNPGDRLSLVIYPSGHSEEQTLLWAPPAGATEFGFQGAQPEPGGPPFLFKDAYEGLIVSYTAPPMETGQTERTLTDTFQANHGDGSSGVAVLQTKLTRPYHRRDSSQTAVSSASSPSLPSRARQADVDSWHITSSVGSGGITLTTDLCNEWISYLEGDDYFIAVRMPMATTAPTMSYPLPFVFGGPYSQTLSLQEPALGTPHVVAPLEYRLERLDFLTNELPSVEGEHWAALGVASNRPVTCPAGLRVAPDEWEIQADLLLDLSDQPDDCQGCVLSYYYCYEGQASPWGLAAPTLARTMGLESYQNQGVTCFGPRTLPLIPSGSGLYLSGIDSAHIMPTQRIEMRETLQNETDTPLRVKVDHASTVAGWEMYGGTWEEPDLGDPIAKGSEIDLGTSFPSSRQLLWLINDVPAETSAGSHSLVISATVAADPELSTFDTIPLWCGDWVAPPEASCKALTSVAVDGATSGPTGTYSFTARTTPTTATLPITYTWEADAQTPMTHRNRGVEDTITYTWAITGPQVITVTAANECGAEASATHTITIETPMACDAITSLSLDGPPTTTVGVSTAFTATAGPSTTTLPITYTWRATEQTPVVHADRDSISDTFSFTWDISGTKDVTVTAANECSEFVSAPRHIHVEEAAEERWTIYLPLVLRN